jgi:predicted nucleotidyltransferase
MYIDEMKTHHMTLALGVLCLILQMGEKITLATRNLFYILIMSIYLHSILTYMVYPNKLGWLDCYRIRKNICRSRVMNADINMSREKIADFCRRNHIRRLAFFGSVLRDDFGPDSDIDVLVKFEPGARVGLITLAGMEIELSELLGRKAEMHTVKGLNPHFRDEVLNLAEVQYEQA